MQSHRVHESFIELMKTAYHDPSLMKHLQAVPNFWDIIEYGRESYEIRQSRMLMWLLDPNAGHGLGDQFFRRILHLACDKSEAPSSSHAARDRLGESTDLRRVSVRVEVPITGDSDEGPLRGRLDLLFIDHQRRVFLAIENKTGSLEHNVGDAQDVSQLEAYRSFLTSNHPGYEGAFVFLAPLETITESPGWVNVAHQDLFPVYDDFATQLSEDYHSRKLIQDFRYDLARKLDRTLTDKAGLFMFKNYEPTESLRNLEPSSGLFGVMTLLPADTWDDEASGEVAKALSPEYRHWRQQLLDADPDPENWSDLALTTADAIGGDATPDDIQRLALLLWQHRPTRGIDQTRSPMLQKLMRQLFSHFTGIPLQHVNPGQRAEATLEFADLFRQIHLTQGGGQGIWLHVDEDVAYKLQGSAKAGSTNPLWCFHLGGRKPAAVKIDGTLLCEPTTFGPTVPADWGYSDSHTPHSRQSSPDGLHEGRRDNLASVVEQQTWSLQVEKLISVIRSCEATRKASAQN